MAEISLCLKGTTNKWQKNHDLCFFSFAIRSQLIRSHSHFTFYQLPRFLIEKKTEKVFCFPFFWHAQFE